MSMFDPTLTDFSRLCLHTITTKPLEIEKAAELYAKESIPAITVWRQALEGRNIDETGRMLRAHNLRIVSLCRGGFFPHRDQSAREKAIEDNKRAIDEAAALGAPLIVLVCGASPDQPLEISRDQIRNGIEAVLPHAERHNIRLAIEPLHPMYADTRSAINTLRQANQMAERIDSPFVGVAVDVYHLWWDPDLEKEIQRCGTAGNIFAFHVCDWRVPTEDLLLDRGLMGEGCINIRQIRGWVEAAGFSGDIEVEIFSKRYWQGNQREFIKKIKRAYLECV